MPLVGRKEIRRFEYNGCIIVEVQYPPERNLPPYSRWEVNKINPDGTHSYFGYESTERLAMMYVDFVINGKPGQMGLIKPHQLRPTFHRHPDETAPDCA